jgi:hypothetical protein
MLGILPVVQEGGITMRPTVILAAVLAASIAVSAESPCCRAQGMPLFFSESFEQSETGECPETWTCSAPNGDARVVESVACDGFKSLELSHDTPQAGQSSIAYTNVSFDCLQSFIVEFCLTSDNVEDGGAYLSLVRFDGFLYFSVLEFGIEEGEFFWSTGFDSYVIDSPVPMNNTTYEMTIEYQMPDILRFMVDGEVVEETQWTYPCDFVTSIWLTTSSGSVATAHFDNIEVYRGEFPEDVEADIQFQPSTIFCRGTVKRIGCYIELPGQHRPGRIIASTILINDQISPLPDPIRIVDHDMDGILEAYCVFYGQDLVSVLEENQVNQLTLSFDLIDGTHCVGVGSLKYMCRVFRAAGGGIGPLFISPNFSNSSALINFELGASGSVSLCIHDIRGRLVRTLVDEVKAPGRYEVIWEGETDYGTDAPAGMYFVRLDVSGEVRTGKAMYLR